MASALSGARCCAGMCTLTYISQNEHQCDKCVMLPDKNIYISSPHPNYLPSKHANRRIKLMMASKEQEEEMGDCASPVKKGNLRQTTQSSHPSNPSFASARILSECGWWVVGLVDGGWLVVVALSKGVARSGSSSQYPNAFCLATNNPHAQTCHSSHHCQYTACNNHDGNCSCGCNFVAAARVWRWR